MMERVTGVELDKQVSSGDKEFIIDEFINFASEKLGLGENMPNITISHDSNEAVDMKSFGKYTPGDGKILVVAANRNTADILRTLGHEMVHFKQYEEGRLKPNSGEDGTEFENEANSVAGVLMREFGRNNPKIFE